MVGIGVAPSRGEAVRIRFRKLNDERHALEITRIDGTCERMECETRSYLVHDLLHYAVEREAGLDVGFWAQLANGRTLAALNARDGSAMVDPVGELQAIEGIVGMLTAAAKGRPAAEVAQGVQRYFAALGAEPPPWSTPEFVAAVQERMRRLLGAWKATRHGDALELSWP